MWVDGWENTNQSAKSRPARNNQEQPGPNKHDSHQNAKSNHGPIMFSQAGSRLIIFSRRQEQIRAGEASQARPGQTQLGPARPREENAGTLIGHFYDNNGKILSTLTESRSQICESRLSHAPRDSRRHKLAPLAGVFVVSVWPQPRQQG